MSDVRIYRLVPYIRSKITTSGCMFTAILALLPCAGAGIYQYGLHAALILAISVAAAAASELICDLAMHKEVTVTDYSAALSGLIGGLILPPEVPLWYPVISAAVAIVLAKMAFGGIGKNILNPAATGKIVLIILMNTVLPGLAGGGYSEVPALTQAAAGTAVPLKAELLCGTAGFIGTGNAVCVLAGALLLFVLGIADILIPFCALTAFAAFFILFGQHGLSTYALAQQMAGGGMLFTFFFMANDYTTSPVTINGRIAYGILLGILTGIARKMGFMENGALYALFAASCCSRWLDRVLLRRPFGVHKEGRQVLLLRGAQTKEQAEREAERQKKEDEQQGDAYADFMTKVMPGEAAEGSETAGTIDANALAARSSRARVEGSISYDDGTGQTAGEETPGNEPGNMQGAGLSGNYEGAAAQGAAPDNSAAPGGPADSFRNVGYYGPDGMFYMPDGGPVYAPQGYFNDDGVFVGPDGRPYYGPDGMLYDGRDGYYAPDGLYYGPDGMPHFAPSGYWDEDGYFYGADGVPYPDSYGKSPYGQAVTRLPQDQLPQEDLFDQTGMLPPNILQGAGNMKDAGRPGEMHRQGAAPSEEVPAPETPEADRNPSGLQSGGAPQEDLQFTDLNELLGLSEDQLNQPETETPEMNPPKREEIPGDHKRPKPMQ